MSRPAAARQRPFALACLAAAIALALSACGDRDAAEARTQPGTAEALPAPGEVRGVTGDPEVAPGRQSQAPALGDGPGALPSPGELGIDTLGVVPGQETGLNPETGLQADPDGDGPLTAPPAADAGAAEPTPADAVSVIRDYYAAINAQQYPSAYALWSDGGNASRQTPGQFAQGFAQTRQVAVVVGAPGREDAGAGQRYIEIPVSVRATQADGSVRRFAGTYVLHRTVVDGATQDQRSWRIRSADLREVSP